MSDRRLAVLGALCLAWLLAACRPAAGDRNAATGPQPTRPAPVVATVSAPNPTATPLPPPPALTPRPSLTPALSATPAPQATATPPPPPTATPVDLCDRRLPGEGLLTLVTQTYGLSRDYEPADLVDLNEQLPPRVTLGYPSQLRAVAVPALVAMIADMEAAGLHPQILSGYRSYSAQAIARQKWRQWNPEAVAILSAAPGHSEHQLGTTVDFGSPELADIIGRDDLQFHTLFAQTSEGAWLLEHAPAYGFTLSYPRDALDVTGFYYEPWHYRYVGSEMAEMLAARGISLTAYLLESEPAPCVP